LSSNYTKQHDKVSIGECNFCVQGALKLTYVNLKVHNVSADARMPPAGIKVRKRKDGRKGGGRGQKD